MEENKNNLLSKEEKAEESVSFENAPIDIPFAVGQEGKDVNGNDVDSSAFTLVQQDKKLHDVKFTTKPTTFFKDAMRRFTKNRSSVVGGIILGVLFLLAIILPIHGVLPYDINTTHNYETHLPMKLFPASNGFWDGTKMYYDAPYPYIDDDEGNHVTYIGTEHPDDSYIVSVKNIHAGYQDGTDPNGSGGYARINKKATETGYSLLRSPYRDFSGTSTYTVNYTLGWRDEEDYIKPKYALIAYTSNEEIIPLTDYTDEYGELEKLPDQYATVASYPTVTVNNVNQLIQEKVPAADRTNLALGLEMLADKDHPTAMFIKSFEIRSDNPTETAGLRALSFGTEKYSRIADANALLRMSTSDANSWRSISDDQCRPVDTAITKCDIRKDMYELAYGYRDDLSAISGSVFEQWIEDGLIDYKSVSEIQVGELKLTPEGEESGDVYVSNVNRITRGTDIDGNTTYSMNCTVLAWKYFGYKSVPIHIFGTERFGYDMLKYVFSGLRTSLILGIIVSAINIAIGVVWGSISGYFGGLTDLVMERITDVLSGIPWIVLMTVLTLKLGQNFFVFALALCLTGWIGTESITRSQFYRYKGREYVLAAKTLGARAPRLIFRHILPNAIGTIVTSSVLMIPSVIFNEATISFLGLGLQGMNSLGVILSRTETTFSTYPSELLFPSVIISLLMICFNLFGNGLRDAFNPSLKGSE